MCKFFRPGYTIFYTFILWAATVLMGCSSPTPPASGILVALQQMQDLATAEYTITKVVKASDNKTWFKIGDRKILITCEATVKAGIDFAAMDTRYVSKKGKTISLQLPPPKIISVSIPPEKIRVAYQEIGFFRNNFSTAEQNSLLQQAEKQIVAKANTLGILEDAKNNTRTWLISYLSALGFEEIDIQFEGPITIKNR
jgi:hypothetical protein